MGKGARLRRERREGVRDTRERKQARVEIRRNLELCRADGIRCAQQFRYYDASLEGLAVPANNTRSMLDHLDAVWTLEDLMLVAAFAENDYRDLAAEWGFET